MGTLSKKKIAIVSKRCGFEQRQSGKISAHALVLSFMQMMVTGQTSYWSWARSLSLLIVHTISKQAIFYRMNTAWVSTVKALVAEVIGQQAVKQIKHELFTGFTNVWLQDSTCIHLPDALNQKFKGSVVSGKQNSVAKLHVVVHALTGLCPLMEWGSYHIPEQTLASAIMGIAKAGDLVIRDLGYLVLREFTRMNQEGIFFLSRWKYKMLLFNPQTGEEIDLLKTLEGKSYLDMQVLCGRTERVKLRVVAIPLPPAQAEERRRKAKKDGKKKTNHNTEYYALLGYVIFVTNVGEEVWNHQQVAQAYRVRWNVEILFKSWKSGLHVERMIPDAKKHSNRIESILYLLLLYVAWFQLLIYAPLNWRCRQKGKCLSVIQSAKWMLANTMRWIVGAITNSMEKEIFYYCCYDTRRKPNAIHRLEQFTKPLT
ncbi:MAG: IS4 family transposase [Bacteroidetes bacterium]|nr:IS4 family transposase [Bacteroidota bacterium]